MSKDDNTIESIEKEIKELKASIEILLQKSESLVDDADVAVMKMVEGASTAK